MKDPESARRYTLADLVAQIKAASPHARVSERTIRNWISTDVIPPPDGLGRGSHFGEKHLVRLRFIVKAREQLGQRVPLQALAEAMRSLSEVEIARIANGEEPVRALTVSPGRTSQFQDSLPPPGPTVLEEETATFDYSPPPKRRPQVARSEPYTTIDVADGIQLRMKGDEPDKVATLAQLARKLREWISDGG